MNYAEYMKSTMWKKVRAAAWQSLEKREEEIDYEVFEVGGIFPIHKEWDYFGEFDAHHWRYPDDFRDDEEENVIVMCLNCHHFIHYFDVNRWAWTYYDCGYKFPKPQNSLFNKCKAFSSRAAAIAAYQHTWETRHKNKNNSPKSIGEMLRNLKTGTL